MKNHRSPSIRFFLIAAIVCLSLIVCVFGSLAIYVSSTDGSDNIEVATWHVEVNGLNISTVEKQTFDFNLFETVNEEDTVTEEDSVVDGILIYTKKIKK